MIQYVKFFYTELYSYNRLINEVLKSKFDFRVNIP